MQIVDEFNYDQVNKADLSQVGHHGNITSEEEGLFFFGDFNDKDYDTFFSCDNICSDFVEFVNNDTYNSTQSWVEEGHKHLLNLEPIEDEVLIFGEQPGDIRLDSSVNTSLNGECGTDVEEGITINGHASDREFCEQVSQLHMNEEKEKIIFCEEITIENANDNEKCITEDDAPPEPTLNGDTVENVVENEPPPPEEKVENEPKVEDEQSKKKSWASLFKSSEPVVENSLNGVKSVRAVKVEIPVVTSEVVEKEKVTESSLSMISMEQDERASKLAEFISHWYPDYSRTHVQLHGLINRANWCYINATLQALLAIPAIYHFYKNLGEFLNDTNKSTSTPLTDSMITFFSRFQPVEVTGKRENEDLHYGSAFEPKGVYDVLTIMKSSLSEKGRQEDAEEFLSFLLNGIHDELVALSKLVVPKVKDDEIIENGDMHEENESEEEVWEEVGPKNKVRTIRKAVIEESLIKHVFGGVICSSVLQTGAKESTTFQPFFTLQLDIQSENIQTLNNAIEFYFMKEKLQGFTCSKTKTEVEASRRISLEELPLMFIFHLKYFVFDRKGGSQKLHKEIDIPVDLEIPRDILSNSKNPNTTRRYKLHAVVYHHGKHAAGGHYTASVHHGNPFGWVHFDDNHIKNVSMNEMIKHQQGAVPYLLFYEKIQHR